MSKIIVANWKANLLPKESLVLAKKYSTLKSVKADIIACPDFLALSAAAQLLKKSAVNLGAQDCASFSVGSHTGDIPAIALKSIGAKYIIAGHSEKRASGDTNKIVSEKVQKILTEKLTPIICIGESASERRAKKTAAVFRKQLAAIFGNLSQTQLTQSIFIAYEPLWAIGSGKALIAEEAAELCELARKTALSFGASKIKVLYGGSVDTKNAAGYLQKNEIDGLLIGGASLNFQAFKKIINF